MRSINESITQSIIASLAEISRRSAQRSSAGLPRGRAASPLRMTVLMGLHDLLRLALPSHNDLSHIAERGSASYRLRLVLLSEMRLSLVEAVFEVLQLLSVGGSLEVVFLA